MNHKITIISVLIMSVTLFSSCYTNRAAADRTTSADYNKRVSVSGAHTIKRGNALNVTFNVGLIGAGAYAGYTNLSLISTQTATGRQPVPIANAAVGALAGAGLGLLCDYAMGRNGRNYKVDPQKWIYKSNKDYLLLNTFDKNNFQIIHSSAEQNYIVRNIQDVKDFKQAFPQSLYANSIFQQAMKILPRHNLPELIALYPSNQNVEKTKAMYIQKSISFSEASEAAIKYPLENADELCVDLVVNTKDAIEFLKLYPVSNYKKKAVINAFVSSVPSFSDMYNLKNVYGDLIYLNSSDLQNQQVHVLRHYYCGMYNFSSPATSTQFDNFNLRYKWLTYPGKNDELLSSFWDLNDRLYRNGSDVISNFKSIIANPLYADNKISAKEILNVMEDKFTKEITDKVAIINNQFLSSENENWDKWLSSNNYTAGLVEEKGIIQFLAYGEVKSNSKYDLPVLIKLQASLVSHTKIQGTGTISNLLVGAVKAFGGESAVSQQTYLGDAEAAFVIPMLSSGEKIVYAIDLDFGEGIKRHGTNIMDALKVTSEKKLDNIQMQYGLLSYDRSSDIEKLKEQLELQEQWQQMAVNGIPSGKLMDAWRGKEFNQEVWDLEYIRLQEAVRKAIKEQAIKDCANCEIDETKTTFPKEEEGLFFSVDKPGIIKMKNEKEYNFWQNSDGTWSVSTGWFSSQNFSSFYEMKVYFLKKCVENYCK